MIDSDERVVAAEGAVPNNRGEGQGFETTTNNNQSMSSEELRLPAAEALGAASSLVAQQQQQHEARSAATTKNHENNNRTSRSQGTRDESSNASQQNEVPPNVGQASVPSEDKGQMKRKSLQEMQIMVEEDSLPSLHSSFVQQQQPAAGSSRGGGGGHYSSRELDKIMEAHRLLCSFGGSSGSGGGPGCGCVGSDASGVISQRHSFGCKDSHPSSSAKKEVLRPNEILRMSQSLRADMLPRGMMGTTDCAVDDNHGHTDHISGSISKKMNKESTTTTTKATISKQEEQEEERDRAIREILGTTATKTPLSKQQQKERDRAIREILGEFSSSEEEQEDEVNQKKRVMKAREKQQQEEDQEELQQEQYQSTPPSNIGRGSVTSTSFAARLARKQREMDVSTQSTQSSDSLSPTPRRAQRMRQSSSRLPPARLPSHASSKSSGTYSEASAPSDGMEDDDFSSIDSNEDATNNLTTGTLPPNQPSSQSQRQLTPFQRQMQQQLSSRTTSSAATSARTISTASSLPGAYPTAGIAPFANPHPTGGAPTSQTRSEEVGHNNVEGDNNNHHNVSTRLGMEQHPPELLQEEIVAICVDDLVDEENKISRDDIREEIIRSAAQADVVDVLDDDDPNFNGNVNEKMLKQLKLFTYGLLLLVVAIAAVGLAMGLLVRKDRNDDSDSQVDDELVISIAPSEAPSMSPTETPIPTLQKVRQEGVLRCGIYETTGFDEMSGERFGSDVDWCRAIAAAIHGRDSYEVVLIDVTFADRFHLIANGTIDVLTASSTYTMDRNVYEMEVETGLTFSPPFLYDGMRFAGVPEFVECADNDMKNFFECRDIMVCVVGGTSYQVILGSRLPKRQIITVSGWQELYGSIRDGLCNVIAAEGVSLGERNVRAFGYEGNYTVGHSLYSKIPLSMVTRDDDPQWSDFVVTVMQSTFVAEQAGITQETSYLVSDAFISGSTLFGDGFDNMFEDVIATIGNYGEFYARHAESAITREGLNLLNDGSSGLLFSPPFGFILNEGPGPVEGGTLERIMQRGKLRCALRPGRLGFAEATRPLLNHSNRTYIGFDVDFCRALATSIFSGSVDLVEFVEVANDESEFAALAKGEVDVLSGGRWTLQNDVKDPFTGQGFSFSSPYFYGADILDLDDTEGFEEHLNDHLCMVTRQDDHQWSAFVYWLVASTIYAEEMGIDQRLSNKMPEVHIFGPGFLRMLRDPILEFGNIGELYERNLQTLIPRSGRNQVNTIRAPGPQIYPIPGMLLK